MIRTLLVVLLVAGLSCWINQLEMVHGDSASLAYSTNLAQSTEWVFTADGWEPTAVLAGRSASPSLLHPLTVATMQLCGSLLVLMAFPSRLPRPE